MKRIRRLNIHTPQGFSGVLARESQYVFAYQATDPAQEISLVMPLRVASYQTNQLPGVFRQNLPEGYLDQWIKERLAKVARVDEMSILSIVGRDVIGRVSCRLEGDEGAPKGPREHLSDILTWQGTEDLFQHLVEQYALSSGISGVQPKVVVPIERDAYEKISVKSDSLIVKSSGDEWPHLAENEYFCMSIAKRAGLQVPGFWLSEDRQRFVVERFDLTENGYLGFEDMTALMNLNNDQKYDGSYEGVAKAIRIFVTPEWVTDSLNEYFRSVCLSMLLRNGDAHLKNFGLRYTTPQTQDVRLSPLYDVVNTLVYLPKDVPALRLNKAKSWPSKQTLIEFGKVHCRVDRPERILEEIADAAMAYRPEFLSEIWEQMVPSIDYACCDLASRRSLG